MLFEQIIANTPSFQSYEHVSTEIVKDGKHLALHVESRRDAAEERCSYCGGLVHICGSCGMRLKDMPINPGMRQEIEITYHRYRCMSCARIFCEEIPFKHLETRITDRAASLISAFLRFNMLINTVQKITVVHWDTIKRIRKTLMDEAIAERRRGLLREGYKPKHLAVDEFAIHKRHRYATCVMDLDTGDVLWGGRGRMKVNFAVFFQNMDKNYLRDVEYAS